MYTHRLCRFYTQLYIFVCNLYIFIMFQEMIESKLHEVAGESCEKEDDEDCLIRRTLTGHLDYIYTEKNNNS